MTKTNVSLQLLCAAALLVGGLAFGSTADASNCVDDQFSGVCLPLESAPAQADVVNLAQADPSCDQFSGVCQTEEIRSIEWQPTQVAADYSPCDQFSGVCAETPSIQGDRAQQGAVSSDL